MVQVASPTAAVLLAPVTGGPTRHICLRHGGIDRAVVLQESALDHLYDVYDAKGNH